MEDLIHLSTANVVKGHVHVCSILMTYIKHADVFREGGELETVTQQLYDDCKQSIEQISVINSQHVLNGVRNAWILKPAAKSRGRGIQVADKLGTCLQQAESDGGAMVVQKYIERPLCVYNTKFDIRQWFLVTDWNPLTVWFYKDCYLRFCSQEYTLDDFKA